jgi:hypothetical protein
MNDIVLKEKYNYIQRQPLEIVISSKTGTNISTLDGHKFFTLETEIVARKDEKILLYLKKAFIPFSFYTLSETQKNNKLDIQEVQVDGTTNDYTITIPDANYNINQLLKQIKTLMETSSTFNFKYSITYDEPTAKVHFLISSGTNILKTILKFNTGSNKLNSVDNILGFTDSADLEFTSTTELVSTNIVDMADGLDSIHIKSNLVGDNIQSTSEDGSELLIVPIDKEPNSILYFDEGSNPFKHLLSQESIKRIEIKMVDGNNNVIDFNNVPYTLILIIEFLFNPNQSLSQDNKKLETQDKINKTIDNNLKLTKAILDGLNNKKDNIKKKN